jgi:hypothetical protein
VSGVLCAQQIAISEIRSVRQQHAEPIELMVAAQRQTEPAVSELFRLSARTSPIALAA